MEFPLAALELHRVARRRDLYFYRTVVALTAGAALLFGGVAATGSRTVYMGGQAFNGTEWLAHFLAQLATALQTMTVLVITPLLTAGSIAREKRDRTIGLLLLADFRGDDIYLAKFASAFAGAESLVLCTLPLMVFGGFFGGIDLQAIGAQMLAATGCVVFACTLGLLFSALLPNGGSAFVLTGLILTASGFFLRGWPGILLPLLPGAPAWTRYTVLDWHSVALWSVMGAGSVLAAVFTVWLLPRLARDRAASPRRYDRALRRYRHPPAEWKARTAGRVLREAGAESLSLLPTLVFITPLCLAALPLAPYGGLWLLVIALACTDLLHSLYYLSRSRALEEILVAPLEDIDLANALWFGATRRSGLYGLAVIVALSPIGWRALLHDASLRGWPPDDWSHLFYLTSVLILLAVLLAAFQMLALRAFCCTVSQRSELYPAWTIYALIAFVGAHVGCLTLGLTLLFSAFPVLQDTGPTTLVIAIVTLVAILAYVSVARNYWFEFNHGLRYWLLENLQVRDK